MPLWACQGKARKNPDFSVSFNNFPQFCHRPIIPGLYPTPPGNGGIGHRFATGRMTIIIVMSGWWQQLQSRRRHRQDIRAFQRLMDAREAARRSAA
jgi:hypothetical protein